MKTGCLLLTTVFAFVWGVACCTAGPDRVPPVRYTAKAHAGGDAGLASLCSRLREAFTSSRGPDTIGDSGYVVRAAVYRCRVTAKGVSVDAGYRIEIGPERGAVSVPLVGGPIGVRQREVPESAYLLCRGNEVHAVLTEPGVSDVALRFDVAVQREGRGAQARFAAAPAVIRELMVTAGPEVAGNVSVPGVPMQEGPDGCEGVLDDRNDVVLLWTVSAGETPGDAGARKDSIAACHGDHVARYGEDTLEIDSTYALEIEPPGIRHAALRLAPGTELSEVAGDGIRDWKRTDGTALQIGFNEPRTGTCRFRLRGTVKLPALPAEHALVLPYVLTRAHQSGALVLAERGVRVDVLEVASMHGADATGMVSHAGSESLCASNTVASFVVTGATNAGARVLLKPLRPSIRVEVAAKVVVSGDRTILTHDAALHVSERALRELPVVRQPAGRIVSVEGPAVAGWTTGPSNDGDETILVRFEKPVLGKTTLSIRVDRDYDALPETQCLSGFRIPGATLTHGRVRTYAGEGVAIDTTSITGLMALPRSAAPPDGVTEKVTPLHTYALRTQDWRLDLSSRPRASELSVETFMLLEAAEDAFLGRLLCHCLVEHAPRTGLTIDLPANWENVTVEGAAVSRFWLEKEALHVALNGEVKGPEALVLSFETTADAATGVAEISGPVFRDTTAQSGVLAVVGGGELAVTERSRQDLDQIASEKIPLRYALLPGDEPTLAYRHGTATWNLSLTTVRSRVVDTPDILVDSAHFRSRVSPGGRTVTRATYRVRNSGRRHLRVRLPDSVTLIGAFVDGREAVTHVEQGEILLRIPRHGPERAFDVDLRCMSKQRVSRSRWQLLAVRLCAPSINVPVRAAAWEVRPRSPMRAVRRLAVPGLVPDERADSDGSLRRLLTRVSAPAWSWIAAIAACAMLGTACCARLPRPWWPVAGLVLLGLAVAAGYVSETARRTDARVQCQINMCRIEDAVDEVMCMSNFVSVASVTAASVQEMLPGGQLPRCASGGTYDSGSAGCDLQCSVHGANPRNLDSSARSAAARGPELPFGTELEWTASGTLLPAGVRPWVRILAVDPTFLRRLVLVAAVVLAAMGAGLAAWLTPGRFRRRAAVAMLAVAFVLLAARLDGLGRFMAGIPLLTAAACAVLLHVARPGLAARSAKTAALCLFLFASAGVGLVRADRARPPSALDGGLCVQEVTLDVDATEDTAVVDVRIDALIPPSVRDAAAGDSTIPECVLLPAATAVRSIDVSSPDGRGRIVRSDRGLLLRAREPGRYRVGATYVVPVRQEANVSRVTLPLTAAPVRTVNVRVDRENVAMRSPGAVAVDVETRRGATCAVVIPGTGETVELEMMDADSADERGRFSLEAEVKADVRISTSGVLLDAVLSNRPVWGAVDHMVVFLPRHLDLVRVTGDHVSGSRCRPGTNGTRLVVALKQPVTEAFDIRLSCRASVPPLPYDASLPYPVPLEVNRAVGTLTVSSEPGIDLRLCPGKGLRRTRRARVGEGDEGSTSYSFTFDRPNISLDYSAVRARAAVHTEVTGIVQVRDDAVDLSMTYINEVRGSGVAELLAELPHGAELLNATAGDAARCHVREHQGSKWLVVRLRKTCPEHLTYRLTLRWPRAADAVMKLAPARPVGVESCRGMLGVRLAENEYGLYRVTRGLVPCPSERLGDAAPDVSRAFRFNSADWVLEMKAARPRPWIEVFGVHHVRFLSEGAQAISELRCDVQHGTVRQLGVAFCPGASDIRVLSGSARLEPVSNDVYRVVWDTPVTGKRKVRFGYGLSNTGGGANMTIVCPYATDVDRESGYVALAAEDESDMLLVAESVGSTLRECASCPALDRDFDALFAKAQSWYRYTGSPARLTIGLQRRSGIRTTACRVTEAKAIAVLSGTGRLLTRVVYDLSGRGRPLLSAALPPHSRLLSCFVADEPVPVVAEGEHIVVPLGDLGTGENIKRVRLTYVGQAGVGTVTASSGTVPDRLKLALARLSVPIDKLHWTLYLPTGRRYRCTGGTVAMTGPLGRVEAQEGLPDRRTWHPSAEVRSGMARRLMTGARALRLGGDARAAHALYRRAASATGSARDSDALWAFSDLADTVAACFPPLPASADAYEDALSERLRTGRADAGSVEGARTTSSIRTARKRFRSGLHSTSNPRVPQFRFALPVSGLRYAAHVSHVLPGDAPPCLELHAATVGVKDWREPVLWCVLSAGVGLLAVGFRRRRTVPAVLGLLLLVAVYVGAIWL